MARVALKACDNYNNTTVEKAVNQLFDLLGGPARFAAPGERILLKPNLLAADPPEKAVTTHPAIMRAVALALQPCQAQLFYGDSPIYGSTSRVARKCGLEAVADETGVQLLDFKDPESVSYERGSQNRVFEIARAVRNCDRIISLPKLKTHGLTGMTGAVKNQFGCVSGINKGKFHVKLPDADNFVTMLVDLNLCLQPSLFIMDAVMAMEGNGPRGGKPRFIGCILASDDPVALDSIAACLIGFQPGEVPTNRIGQQSGLGTCDLDQIEVVGDDWRRFAVSDFQKSIKNPNNITTGRRGLRNALIARPVIDPDTCTACGICVLACPLEPKALSRPDNAARPQHNYDRCIRCYCCQESCPEGAISLETPVLGRFMSRFT